MALQLNTLTAHQHDSRGMLVLTQDATGVPDIKARFAGFIEALDEERRCVHCGKLYTARQNFAEYACRTHSGTVVKHPHTRQLVCSKCLRIESSPGCTRCVHTASTTARRLLVEEEAYATQIPAEIVDHELLFVSAEMLNTELNEHGNYLARVRACE